MARRNQSMGSRHRPKRRGLENLEGQNQGRQSRRNPGSLRSGTSRSLSRPKASAAATLTELTQHIKDYEEQLQKPGPVADLRTPRAQRQEEVNLTQQVLTCVPDSGLQRLGTAVTAAGFASVRACRDMQASVKTFPFLTEVRQYDTKLQQVRGQLQQEKEAIDGKAAPM